MVIKCCTEGVQGAVEEYMEEKGVWPSLGVNLAEFNSLIPALALWPLKVVCGVRLTAPKALMSCWLRTVGAVSLDFTYLRFRDYRRALGLVLGKQLICTCQLLEGWAS